MKILRPQEVQQFPPERSLSPEELQKAYALSKAEFSAEDLQCFTEVESGVSGEEILRRLEDQQRRLESAD